MNPPVPTEVNTTLVIDTTKIAAAFERLKTQLREALMPAVQGIASAVRAIVPLFERMVERANDPVHVAGLEARYYVRGGMDPSYAAPSDLDRLVRAILDPELEEAEGLFLMNPTNRRLVTVAAMRGWAVHRG